MTKWKIRGMENREDISKIPAVFALCAFTILHAGEMMRVPEGDFIPPFQAKGESGKIRVPSFRLDQEPVTIGDYLAFVQKHPRWRKSAVKRIFADSTYLASWTGDFEPPHGSLLRPASQISWYAAKDYCSALGKRLPSTREWGRVAQVVPSGEDSASYSARILEWYGRPVSDTSSLGNGSINAYGVAQVVSEGMLRRNSSRRCRTDAHRTRGIDYNQDAAWNSAGARLFRGHGTTRTTLSANAL